MMLSIIVPTFNEEATLAKLIERIIAVRLPVSFEIIIIDDHSEDRTWAIAQRLRERYRQHQLIILRNRVNKGKGACVRQGLKHASGDWIIVQDSDLEYDPHDIPKLIAKLQAQGGEAVYGSRFLFSRWPKGMALANYVANRLLTLLTNLLYGLQLTDMETCYKLINRRLLRRLRLRANRFEFEPEVTAQLARTGARINEVPISYHGRTVREGKKIRSKDLFIALWTLLRWRWVRLDAIRIGQGQRSRLSALGKQRTALLILVFAALWAYQCSFTLPFFFDDEDTVLHNLTIRSLLPLWQPFWPPAISAIAGRPITNFTFAINYALGGLNVSGYHVFNWLIHLVTGLLVFGLTRRLLESPILRRHFARASIGLSLSLALLWIVHPLNSEAVVYVTQRTELLVGLFYLLTLYALARGIRERTSRRLWHGIATVACFLGMGAKEVMVSAPITAALMDRVFFARTWDKLLRQRAGVYCCLATSWLFLAVLVAAFPRQGVVGWHFPDLDASAYVGTQFGIILHYLRLVVWPNPLVAYYDWPIARSVAEVLYPGLLIGGLLSATALSWPRWPAISFLGACLWLILAPTSSLLPIVTEIAAERRMYLPSIAVLALLVVGGWLFLETLLSHWQSQKRRVAQMVASATAAIVLATLTLARTLDYADPEHIWRDTVAKQPHSELAHTNLGKVLYLRGRHEEAIRHYKEALRFQPTHAVAHNNWGSALHALKQYKEAMLHFEAALSLKPNDASAYNNMGLLHYDLGQYEQATDYLRKALQLEPDHVKGHYNLSRALEKLGREDEALSHVRKAAKLDPHSASVRILFALSLARTGQQKEALAEYGAILDKYPWCVQWREDFVSALGEGKQRLKPFLQSP